MNITTTSTSKDSARGEDIVLRETSTTRLLFRPMITNNINNSDASVRGWFVYQRKKRDGKWEDYKELDNNKLKADEWIKLELKSEEMLKLMTELDIYYKIYRDYGIEPGVRTYSKTDLQLDRITQMLQDNPSLLDTLLDLHENKGELLQKTLEWMSDTHNSKETVSKLLEIEEDKLEHLNNIVRITHLKKLLTIWEDNKNNNNEEFWQQNFNENAWILSQIFARPFLSFQEKAYLGGKSLDNKGGKIVDFIYQNGLSKEVALIEIKTPNTKLLSNEYRGGVFSIHNDLSGAIVQVLGYKERITKQYASLKEDFDKDFDVFNPQCVVIAGKLDGLEKKKIQSFELYRNELKNVHVITFDELFEKLRLLLDLLAK